MFPCLKLRQLEEILQGIKPFDKPKILLEQYVTPPHLACHMLYTIQSQYGDIDSKFVAELGCGSGSLTIGAAAMDAALVVGFEIDEDALCVFNENVYDFELTNIDVVHCDVTKTLPYRFEKQFDTVIMNPPFGTKHNAGMDVLFLKNAFNLSEGVVYSLHKSSTRSHILKVAKSCGFPGEVLAELKYDLPSTYKFHKQKSVDIHVDLFRFEASNKQ